MNRCCSSPAPMVVTRSPCPRGSGSNCPAGIAIEDNAVASGVSWAPGSDRLVFTGVTPDGRHDVYVARADGTETTAVGPRTRQRVDPAWSPDGQWIAFQGFDPAEQGQVGAYHSRAGLYVMHPDGTGERELAYGDGGSWQYRRPQWAPDPAVARIATNIGESSEYDIAVFDVTTGAMTKLTDDFGADLWPVWSPDGSRIAWSASETGTTIARPDGTDVHSVAGIDYEFVWSPDGTSLYGWKLGDPTTAVIASVDGSKPTIEIPTGGAHGEMRYSWQRAAP